MDGNERIDRGAAWMLELQAGDESAFDRIVAEYQDTVHRLLYRYTGRREGVEDLGQEVFLRIYRARLRYRPEVKFQTWVFRIVFNLCVNETKARRLRRTASLDAGFGPGDDDVRLRDFVADTREDQPLDRIEHDETGRKLRESLAAIPAQQRAAMALYQYRGLSLREIADVMETTEKAVKSLLARARENLREKMAPYLRRPATGEPVLTEDFR